MRGFHLLLFRQFGDQLVVFFLQLLVREFHVFHDALDQMIGQNAFLGAFDFRLNTGFLGQTLGFGFLCQCLEFNKLFQNLVVIGLCLWRKLQFDCVHLFNGDGVAIHNRKNIFLLNGSRYGGGGLFRRGVLTTAGKQQSGAHGKNQRFFQQVHSVTSLRFEVKAGHGLVGVDGCVSGMNTPIHGAICTFRYTPAWT